MTSGKNGSLRYAMFALALLAVITLGFTAFGSDDSYADTGEIKDSENPTGDPIGTYDYTSYVLKLTANGTSSVESIILDGFTDFENATKLVITGFEADIVATSFPSSLYTNLNTILFTGAINTPSIGTWEFNYKTNALTLSATSVSNVSSVSLIGFGNVHKANVTQVTISNFTQDLYKDGEGSIDSSYEDLNGEVYYRGNIVRSSTVTGYWLYDYSDKDLLLQKDSSTTQLGNFNATTGPCYAYFFRTVAESATISGYWTEGNHVLNGFTALKSFRATDYTANTLELLAGLSALQSIQFDVITSVDANLASRVSASLVSVTVPAATKVSDNSFKNFTKLEAVNMVKVTTIGASVFEGCTSLKVVNLPELTSLGSRAFYSCSSIASIYFEDLTSVGSEAFRICGALRTVDCPALTTIGNYAFMECGSLASVNTPSSNSIGTSAFASCGALVSITFGSSVAIGQYAFDACSSLTTIDAEDVKSIAYFAFRNCTSLAGPLNFTSLTKLDGHTVEYSPFFGASVEEIHMPALQEMGTNMFYGSNTLKIVSMGTLQTIPTNTFYGCGALTDVTLSGTVTISGSAFYNCTSLKSITFPDTLTDIKGSAFYSSGLTSLNTNRVQNIEASAFVGSSYLKELIIGPGLVTIGQSAFERVPIEGTVDFSAAVNLTTLGTSAMRYSSVEHLVFSKTAIAAATIGSHAFNDCDRLMSVSFGNQVTVIDTNAFYECTQLSTITFGSDSKVVTINASAFNNTPNAKCDIVFPKTLTTLSSSAFNSSGIMSVKFDVDSAITTISASTFANCKSLVSVNIPKSVTIIGDSSFEACSALETLTLDTGSQLQKVEVQAFYGCVALNSSIEFPATIQELQAQAFLSCKMLSGVTFANTSESNLIWIGYQCFSGCTAIASNITFPDSLKEIEYSAFENCSNITGITFTADSKLISIAKGAFSGCSSISSTINFPATMGGLLGELGAVDERGVLGESAFNGCINLRGITFHEDIKITAISNSCFNNCKSLGGTITFPDSITTYGTNAFYGCSELDGIAFVDDDSDPGSADTETIGHSCFESCTSLAGTIQFPLSLTLIDNEAFMYCDALVGISFATTDDLLSKTKLTSINDLAFHSCDNLTGIIKFPDSLQNIANRAFESCVSITGISFNKEDSELTAIGHRAFYNCRMTADLVLPNSLQTIGTVGSSDEIGAFRGNNFESVEFGSGLISIGYQAFRDCDRMVGTNGGALKFPASLEVIDTLAFYHCNVLRGIEFIGDSNLEHINKRAFESCVLLASVTSTSATDTDLLVNDDAFKGCTALTYFELNNAETFGNNVLDGCKGLLTLKLPAVTTLPKAAYDECTVLQVVDLSSMTTLADGMFKGLTTLVSIDIASVTTLGNDSFKGCTNLTTVDISSVQTIGDNAFYGCDLLTTVTSTSATSVGNNAFDGCSKFTGMTFTGLISIGDYAFNGCSSIVVPEHIMALPNVEAIGDSAFNGCPLVGFSLGKAVQTIGDRALHNPNLATIEVDEDNPYFSIESGVLYDKQKYTLYYSPAKNPATSITIPANVSEIKPYAFQNAAYITNVVFSTENSFSIGEYAFNASAISGELILSERVTSIGQYAFADCTGITSLEIGARDANLMGAYAFKGCSSLEALTIPITVKMVTDANLPVFDSETGITSYVFTGFGSSNLSATYYSTHATKMPWYFTTSGNANITVTFASGVQSIDAYMFKNATAGNSRILSVSIPDSVTAIGVESFQNCSKITSLVLPKNLETIGKDCFKGCTSIQNLTLPIHVNATSLGGAISSIKTLSFTNGGKAGMNYDANTVKNAIWYGSKNYAVTFEDGIASIGNFMQLSATGSVSIPSSVKTIGHQAFYKSTMTTLTIVDGLTGIGNNAFEGCSGLQTLTLPNTLTSIGTTPFKDCTNLRSVYLPITVDYSSNMFDGCRSLSSFTFKAGTDGIGHAYTKQTAVMTPWYGICGMYDFTVSFESGVKSIGNYMFFECVQYGTGGYRGITGTVVFPDSVTSVGDSAFAGCYNVTAFTFGTGLTTIGVEAFRGCTMISTVTIEDRISSIGAGAFSGCTGIQNLTIPAHANTVGSADNPIFKDCTGITNLVFTGNTSYDYKGTSSDSFYRCTPWYFSRGNVLNVTFSPSMESIGDYMFMDCSGFSGALSIPASITDVGQFAFANCKGINYLNIQHSNVLLGKGAFQGCTGIKTLIVPVVINVVGSDESPIFEGCTGITSVSLTGNRNSDNYSVSAGSNNCYKYTPWYYSRNNTISLSIGDGITGIGANMFRDCTGIYGVDGAITIGASLSSIGEYAFAGVSNVNTLSINNSSASIGKGAFQGCSSIHTLTIPITMNAVCDGEVPIFDGCTGITSLKFIGNGSGMVYSESQPSTDYKKTPWYNSSSNYVVTFASTITGIGANTFRDNVKLTGNIVAPDLSTIGDNAFRGCSSVNRFDCAGVNTIGAYAFDGCSSLNEVSLPSITSIPDYAFRGCINLTTATLTNITSVESHAFEGSGIKNLNNNAYVDLSNVTRIGDYAFAKSGVTKIVIGKIDVNINFFGDYVLLECKNLQNVDINGNLSAIPYNTFRTVDTPSSFTSSLTTLKAKKVVKFSALLADYFKSLTTVELDSASDLDHANTKGMFRGCVSLNKFVISDSTITLPESAFEGCSSLTDNSSIDLQNFRFEYGREFYGCIGLNGIVLTASSIPESTFEGCEALKLITATNLTTVGERAFYGTGFTEVSNDVQFPALEEIGKEAFANCKSIVTVNLQKLEGAGEGAFSGCTVMTTVTLPELDSIPAKAFKGDTSLTTVSIGSAGSIGVQAFQNCSGLIELSLPAVTIVGDVETVALNAEDSGDYSVFSGCSKLKKVSMPKVEKIGAFAFYNCSTLSSFNADSDIAKLNGVTYVGYAAMSNTSFTGVTVGKDAVNTDIGDRAFEGCTSMKSFELIGGIGSIGGNSLNGCSLINSLTIPISANWISEYKSSTLKSIHFTVGTDSAGHEYVDQTYTNTFWYNSRNYTVTFDEGITSIGAGMRLSATGSVVIPSTVKSVGSMAFYGAPMTSVTMSEGLTSIGDQAFANCTGLKTAVIPNSIVTIGSSAFEGCTALNSIQLPITVDYSKNTFVGCTALRTFRFTKGDNGVGKGYTEHNVKNTPWYLNSVAGATLTVTFDSGITSIGDNMFRGCTGITGDLTLPSTINHVGCNAFDGVLRITALNVEAASITMEESAFRGCTGIKALTIPVGLNVVGYANSPIFEKCSGITSIHFTGAGSGHIYTENGESAYTATPWYLSRNNTITVTFDDGITSIGDNMFRDCSGLSGTVLCTNVVSVGSHAFSGCINLVGFESDALTTLGEEVFRGARSLVSVDLSGITELPAYTFYDCTELTSIMMEQCRTIGEHAFERSGIKNINGVLGVELATVTQIGDYAFAHSAVERIVLGSQAANIALGDGVLMECPYLKDVTIAGKLNALPKNTFISGDNPSFSSPLRTFVANQVQTISALFTDFKSLTTVEIAGTTSLDADKTRGMFKGCTALKTVTLYQGNNSVALPESAFEGCTSLTTINLNSFTLNGGREFYGCASLESVNLSSATKVPQNAFYGCGDLTEIVAPKVNNIAEFAFASSGLTSILKEVFPVATQIGEGAFQDCKDLTFVEFANVSAVGDAVFKGCTDLESVSLPEVTEITNSMFYNCSSLKGISADNAEKVRELSFYGCRSIIEITLPSVREIGDIAASTSVSIEDYVTKAVFSNCVSLSKVSMENLRSIGALAFYGCSTLVSFNADDSYDLSDVTEIRFGAFSGSGVTDVIVGKSNGISDIGDYAFYNCPRLANFTSESLRTLPEHLFNNTDVNERSSAPMIATITVPSVQMFYANLHGCTYLTKVIAPKATAFNPDTFYGCTLLQSVTLLSDANSDERVTLSTRMFYGCERLASIDLTNALFDGAYTNGSVADTFNGCKALRTIVMPVATKVPSGAFSGCTNITSVYAPLATVIGSDAFNGCISLGYVDMPVATAVHDRAFKDCSSLSEINADTGLNPFINISDIRSEAFYRCGFTDLVLGPNLIGLGASAFAYNPLVEVVIPNSSGTLIIGDKAFQGCPLEDVHISSSVGRIGANAFDYSTVLGIDEANFWFNGSINNGMMLKNSIVGNNHMSVVINADADSSSFVSKFEANGFVTNANVDYIERYIATIQFQTTESGIPSITTMFAIYGGKIVLPYISYGTNYGDVAFATLDGLNNHLSIYASDADYSAKHIARSGDAVPVYPMGDHDSMVFLGSKNTANFIDDMVINTESFGYDVNIEEQTVHYGSIVTVPQFYDSLMNVKGLSVVRYDDVTYNMSIDATEFRAGYYFEYIVIMSEETTIEVWFISKGESVKADVMIQAAFEVPTELKYLESPNAGYSFGGWWTSEGGKGIKAGADTKFAIGQRWYAHFVPLEYTLTIVSDDPEYAAEFTVVGPYSLHVVNKSLYYRDTVNTTNKLVFDATSIIGYSVSTYTDRNNFGRVITGDYVPSVGNMIIDLFMNMNQYEIQLKFTYEGSSISVDETFVIDGWDVGVGNQFHTGSVIGNIPYTMIKDGLYMPLPVHNEYAFGEMNAGSMAVPFVNGKYTLTLDNFNGQTSAVVTYVMLKDQYTIQFMLQDDDNTQFTNSVSITIGDTFMMPSVVRNYSKTGFLFDYLSIDGIDKRYQEREPVVLTQEMADNAKFCVVVVRAQWAPISYDIQFDLAPFTGTVSPVEDVIIGQEIQVPDVSGYSGYRASGWHWVLGDSMSESFSGNVILTKDIVAGYADDTTIVMHVEWSAKKYNLAVDPSSGYKFDVKTATFGENVTLWKNTYNRSFMKFAGWGIGDTVYGDGATVVVDAIMAEAGDSNSDTILFKMSWIANEYQIQYNLDGGEGQIPVDDNAYIVNQTEFKLAVYDESFYQEGYSFVGWKYSKSSYIVYTNTSGLFETVLAQYADENNIVTFYAVWSQKSYKISYDLAGGRAGLNAPTNVFYGDEINISKPTRAGYDFAGWTATGLTGGALYSSSAGYRGWDGEKQVTSTSFMDLCNVDGGVVTLTAHWEQATYLVSYNLNGGSGVIIGGQIQIKVGEIIVQPTLRDANKTGYLYAGWGVDQVNALPAGATFTSDMVSDVENTLVLYAIWTPIDYTVQYRYIDGYAYTTLNVEFGETITLPNLDRSGYTFKGWNITGADANAYYSKDGVTWYRLGTTDVDGMYFRNLTSTDGSVITMEATWSTNEYRISYNSNGGTGKAPVDTNVYRVGDIVQLQDYTVLSGTNGSKSVVGWSLEPNGSSVIIVEFTEGLAMQADATGAINLYAVWVDGMCTVIVDLDGATVSMAPAGWLYNANGTYEKIVDYGTDTSKVMADWNNVTVEKDGYNFTGWNYSSATITSSVTVEPIFEEVNMTILYVFGGVIATFVVGAVVFTRF